jgi:ribosome-binding protein aMBF1 (putative translation factor)
MSRLTPYLERLDDRGMTPLALRYTIRRLTLSIRLADCAMNRRIRQTTPERRAELEALEALIEQDQAELRALAKSEEVRARAIGVRLRAAREAAGLSLKDMAERSGMGKAALSRLENGERNPTVDTLAKFAAALGKEIDVQLVDAV